MNEKIKIHTYREMTWEQESVSQSPVWPTSWFT